MLQSNIKTSQKLDSQDWFGAPTDEHVVAYYPGENELLKSLKDYIGGGILQGDICIVIATAVHLQKLNLLVGTAISLKDNYIAHDAAKTLQSFMIKGLPDAVLFEETVGALIARAASHGKPIRAFGEMVALLWKGGNEEATIMLERMWNDLAKKYKFSLFCAYPELHFIMDKSRHDQITTLHNHESILTFDIDHQKQKLYQTQVNKT